MQPFILILLLLNLCAVVPDQISCPAEQFTALNDCLKKGLTDMMSFTIDDDLKEEGYSCFDRNNCSRPTDGNNIFGSGNLTAYGNNTADQVGDCFLKTADNATFAIEKCVQDSGSENFAILHASDLNSINYKQSFVKEYLKIRDAIDKCPKQSAHAVSQCLMGLMQKVNTVTNAMTKFCKSSAACVKNFKCDFKQLRKQLCTCAKSELNTDSGSVNKYEDNFFTCLHQPTPARQEMIPFVRKVQDLICNGSPCEALAQVKTAQGNRRSHQSAINSYLQKGRSAVNQVMDRVHVDDNNPAHDSEHSQTLQNPSDDS